MFIFLVLYKDINDEYVVYTSSTVLLWNTLSGLSNNKVIPLSVYNSTALRSDTVFSTLESPSTD